MRGGSSDNTLSDRTVSPISQGELSSLLGRHEELRNTEDLLKWGSEPHTPGQYSMANFKNTVKNTSLYALIFLNI